MMPRAGATGWRTKGDLAAPAGLRSRNRLGLSMIMVAKAHLEKTKDPECT